MVSLKLEIYFWISQKVIVPDRSKWSSTVLIVHLPNFLAKLLIELLLVPNSSTKVVVSIGDTFFLRQRLNDGTKEKEKDNES